MPTGKRASMREGPLAALFRKTAEDPGAEGETPKQAPPKAPPPARARKAADPAPAAPAQRRPHPGFDAPAPLPEPEVKIPSPQERLRHAFSSDIPENVMAPPGRARRRAGARCVRASAARR